MTSAFAEPEHQPVFDEVCDLLGARQSSWLELNRFMLEFYGMPGEWRFLGKGRGWVLWFGQGRETLISLYPQPGGLIVQLSLAEWQVPKALALKLLKRTRQIIKETNQTRGVRALFIPVSSEREAGDVKALVMLKKPVKQKRGSP